MIVDMGGVGESTGWTTVNIDDELNAAPNIKCDFTAAAMKLDAFFAPGSMDAIRCIHTLEHLTGDQTLPTLLYWRRFLKPGGELIIVVPNIGQVMRDFVAGRIPFDIAAAIIYSPASALGGSRRNYNGSLLIVHKQGWDEPGMIKLLEQAGYVNIRFGDNTHWASSWTLNYPEFFGRPEHGHYEVPNLRMVANNP